MIFPHGSLSVHEILIFSPARNWSPSDPDHAIPRQRLVHIRRAHRTVVAGESCHGWFARKGQLRLWGAGKGQHWWPNNGVFVEHGIAILETNQCSNCITDAWGKDISLLKNLSVSSLEQVSPPQRHPDQTDGTWMVCEHGGLWFAGNACSKKQLVTHGMAMANEMLIIGCSQDLPCNVMQI